MLIFVIAKFFIIIWFSSSRSFVFEVWVEQVKLLGNLSISESIAAYLHLVFIFDLEYPKVIIYKSYIDLHFAIQEAQTLCDVIQRRFAKYGDESGEYFFFSFLY